MKLFKNFFITIKTKGFIATLLAIKNFFIILLVNVFSSSVFIKRKIFNYKTKYKLKDSIEYMANWISQRGTKKFKYHLNCRKSFYRFSAF